MELQGHPLKTTCVSNKICPNKIEVLSRFTSLALSWESYWELYLNMSKEDMNGELANEERNHELKHGLDEQDVMHNQLSQLWHKLERQQQEQQ